MPKIVGNLGYLVTYEGRPLACADSDGLLYYGPGWATSFGDRRKARRAVEKTLRECPERNWTRARFNIIRLAPEPSSGSFLVTVNLRSGVISNRLPLKV